MNQNRSNTVNSSRKKRNKKSNNVLALLREPYRCNIRNGNICSDELRVTLKYSRIAAIAITVGVPNGYLFRGNGPFDPDLTGAGGQPTGYDQWSAFFNNQRTIASRIRVKPLSTSTTGFGRVVVTPIPGSAAFSVSADFGNASSQKFSSKEVYCNAYTPGQLISMRMTTAQILGKSEEAVQSDDTLGSVIGAVPAVQWIWQISADFTTAAITDTVTCCVEVEYDIVFWGRVNLLQS